jgi:TATA-box binding protein (TBP) (component of TFIID and TFIIIB)
MIKIENEIQNNDALILTKIKMDEVQKQIPVPSKLKISTMTCLYKLNIDINLDILSRFVKIYNKTDEIITSGKGGIVYAEYFMLLPIGQYCGKKAQIKKKELQINKQLKLMFTEDVNYKDQFLGDSKFPEPDPNKSKKKKKKTIKKRKFENQATLIIHFKNRFVNIKVFNNGKIQMTGVRSVEEAHWVIERLIEIIKETKIHKKDLIKVNEDMKINALVKNEYIYTNENDKDIVYRSIVVDGILKLIKIEDEKMDEFEIDKGVIIKIKDNSNSEIVMSNFRIVMINSDYTLGFNINRAKLHAILKKKYNIYATLEPTYQAVKSYYFFLKDQDQNGVCKCEIPCFVLKEQKKKVATTCSQVTIAVFRTGSVIITGGCTIEQTHKAYDFINKVIYDNYDIIKQEKDIIHQKIKSDKSDQNDPIYKIKLLMIERANENRRRAKKKTELKELKEPKEPKEPKEKKEPKTPKEAKDPNVLVIKGKRGRKPKVNPEVKPILVEINEIINYPLS